MPLSLGTVLENRYRIDALLGEGGMGAVYRAWDSRLDQPVAVKENRIVSAASTRQFAREAKMMARLSHPNLPGVIDHFVLPDGAQYLVMKYIEGEDLGQVLQRSGPLDENRALAWIDQVCSALAYLHGQSPPIIHRDIKPNNIKITSRGQVFLVDFGIAKIGDARDRTRTGAIGVSAGYSPPEQHGTGGTDARSDVYALGATLYALLTGCVPPDSVQRSIRAETLVPPRQLRPNLSPTIASAISAALNTAPTDRPQTVADFRVLLHSDAGPGHQPISAEPAPPTVRVRGTRAQKWEPGSKPALGPAGPRRPEAPPGEQTVTPIAPRRRLPVWVWVAGGAAGLLLCGLIVTALTPGWGALLGTRGATPGTPEPNLVATAVPSPLPSTPEPTPEPSTAEPSPSPPTQKPTLTRAAEPLPEDSVAYRVGMVTDVGGMDEGSFNAESWRGVELAKRELGVEVAYLESRKQTDYAANLTAFVDDGYDMIVTVGFLLGADTAKFAEANPDVDFAIVDYTYRPPIDNVLGLAFAVDEAAFLAGYLAAGMTRTGIVGTFGGIDIPPVTMFMEGMKNGVEYYNKEYGTDAQVLGMNRFTGNFESTDDGRQFAEDLIAEGADIIMPVAGLVGLGAAAAIQENPGTMLIGADTDWCVTAAEYCDVTLTSVLKSIDATVLEAIRRSEAGMLRGGVYVGTLENDGVGLAPFHELADDVPIGLKRELVRVQRELIGGSIATGWPPGG